MLVVYGCDTIMKREGEVEKIEVLKGNGSFYYTGILQELDDTWVVINTTRGEVLKFRKEQIMQRRLVGLSGVESFDKRDSSNKSFFK